MLIITTLSNNLKSSKNSRDSLNYKKLLRLKSTIKPYKT